MSEGMTFGCLQERAHAWQVKNFGEQPASRMLMGVVEEVGELAHAQLKMEQGIRGSAAEHEATGKDAVGDILVYLANYCSMKGWSMQEAIEETWAAVSKRDWKLFPKNGLTE